MGGRVGIRSASTLGAAHSAARPGAAEPAREGDRRSLPVRGAFDTPAACQAIDDFVRDGVGQERVDAGAGDLDLDRARHRPKRDLERLPTLMSDGRCADLRQDQLRLLHLVVARVGEEAAQRGAAHAQVRGLGGDRQAHVRLGRHVEPYRQARVGKRRRRRACRRPRRAGARDRVRHRPACRRAAAQVGGGRRAGRDRGLDDPCRGPAWGARSVVLGFAGRRMGGARVAHSRATWRGSDAGRSRPPRRASVASPRRGCLTWPPGRTHHRWKPPSKEHPHP